MIYHVFRLLVLNKCQKLGARVLCVIPVYLGQGVCDTVHA